MEEYNILDRKSVIFFNPQQFDKALNTGDLISVNGISYFVTDSGFASPLNPMIMVWPAKLTFPNDFLDSSFLYDWLKGHFKDIVVEASNNERKVITGKIVELFTDKIVRVFPDYFSNLKSHNYYEGDYISRIKILPFGVDTQSAVIDIHLDQYPKIEIKSNY